MNNKSLVLKLYSPVKEFLEGINVLLYVEGMKRVKKELKEEYIGCEITVNSNNW